MLNYYLFSFNKIEGNINVSSTLGINISNVDEYDKKFIFHHLNGSLNITEEHYIKEKNQLDGLIKLSFINEKYNSLLGISNKINERRNNLYKEEQNETLRFEKDERLYLDAKKNGDKLLEIHETQKNYLNTILFCVGLSDYLIDLGNFSLEKKVKFDLDLNHHNVFKPLTDKGIKYNNGLEYLNYLDFSLFQSQLLDIGDIIDTTFGFHKNSDKFIDDINHIGGLIQIYLLANTDKIKITALVSILEYLLIRKPNPNMVCQKEEDGITKQFNYKIFKSIENKIKIININKNDIKKIYEIRSNIVHGNKTRLKDIEIWLHKIKKIIFLVLNERIKQPEYFDFLKNIKKIINELS